MECHTEDVIDDEYLLRGHPFVQKSFAGNDEFITAQKCQQASSFNIGLMLSGQDQNGHASERADIYLKARKCKCQ